MSDALTVALDQLFNSRRLDPELLAEDAEWVNPHDAVEPGTRRGSDEFNRALASVFATWDDVRFDTAGTDDSEFRFEWINDPESVVRSVDEATHAASQQQPPPAAPEPTAS